MFIKNICFLVSGGGGTLRFVDQAIRQLQLPFRVSGVISDRECGAIKYCEVTGIPYRILHNWKEEEYQIGNIFAVFSPDVVVTTIHKKLSNETLKSTKATFINLHYSLLPSYGGVIGFKTLELAKKNNAQIIGVTTHHVSEDLDGGEIMSQAAMPVDWTMDLNPIGDKVFRMACLTILNTILRVDNPESAITFENPSDTIYSPKLQFNTNLFDEEFWDSLK